jgi:hypothetical protein
MPLHRTAALLISAGVALASNSTTAAAQELEAVQGFIATATLRYSATFANMLGFAPGTVTYHYRIRIADGIALANVSREVEAITSLGPGDAAASHSFSGRIARPGQSNFGQYLWEFSSGTLTLLGTPQTGGFQLTIHFMQGETGILCSAAAPYVPDNSTASQLAFGGQVVIADMQQVESRCAVSTS